MASYWGAAEWEGEKLPAFVILTRSSMQETTIKHPAPHLTWADSIDVKGDGSDMVGGVRVLCILGLAALWAQGDHKDTGFQALGCSLG